MAQAKKFKGDEKQMKLDIKRRGVGQTKIKFDKKRKKKRKERRDFRNRYFEWMK